MRLAGGKSGLTVFDFIAQQHRSFRFDQRFRALTGASRRAIEEQIAADVPDLPPGCQISPDPVARDIVLSDVREAFRPPVAGSRRNSVPWATGRIGGGRMHLAAQWEGSSGS